MPVETSTAPVSNNKTPSGPTGKIAFIVLQERFKQIYNRYSNSQLRNLAAVVIPATFGRETQSVELEFTDGSLDIYEWREKGNSEDGKIFYGWDFVRRESNNAETTPEVTATVTEEIEETPLPKKSTPKIGKGVKKKVVKETTPVSETQELAETVATN